MLDFEGSFLEISHGAFFDLVRAANMSIATVSPNKLTPHMDRSFALASRSMTVDFCTPGGTVWQKLLSGIDHDVYHTPEYLAFAALAHGGAPEAVLVRSGDDFLFAPYLTRPIAQMNWLSDVSPDWNDFYTPYGYVSPLWRGSNEFLIRAVAAWKEEAARRNFISGFVRIHPFIALPEDLWGQQDAFVRRGDTVAFDLRQSEDEIWSQVRHNHRRNINALVRQGCALEEDQGFSQIDTFIGMYEDTMRRVNSSPFYFFPRSYYLSLRDHLKNQVRLFFVKNANGDPIAGGVFFVCKRIMQYHLGGTHPAMLDLAPSKFMLHRAALWGKAQGCDYLHLGGGLAAQRDALFQFKAGFSNTILPHYTWHMVFNAKRYQELSELRAGRVGPPADAQFFPTYRAFPVIKPVTEPVSD